MRRTAFLARGLGAVAWAAYLAGPEKTPIEVGPTDGDILWLYNMIEDLKVRPHDASSCSVLIHGDVLYVCTGNAKGRGSSPTAFPLSPSLIALDKRTGRLLAKDDERIGTRLYKGQWSSPSSITVGGKNQILYGGGDGVCYAFEPVLPETGDGISLLKKTWLGTTRRDLWVLAAGKEKKLLHTIRLDSGITATPCAAHGVLFVASQRYLWAVQQAKQR